MSATLSDLTRALQGLRRDLGGVRPLIVMMTDDARLADPVSAAARLPAGGLVIARSRDSGRLRRLVAALLPVCRARRLGLLIAGDARLACASAADGVHLSETDLRRRPRRPWPHRPGWIVSASAHDAGAVRRAGRAGADLVLLSPVFSTPSHPGSRPLGSLRFAALTHSSALPVLALGGIDLKTAQRLGGTGAAGVAGIGLWSGADTRTGI